MFHVVKRSAQNAFHSVSWRAIVLPHLHDSCTETKSFGTSWFSMSSAKSSSKSTSSMSCQATLGRTATNESTFVC